VPTVAAVTAALLLPGWTQIQSGPHGGALWQGRIPGNPTRSLVYLPPDTSRSSSYPLLVVLHGFPGDAWSVGLGLRFARVADDAIAAGRVAPFVAVVPTSRLHGGEWAGRWERWVVNGVVPWARARLPVGGGVAIAGLSAGGYGAVDIGLRHPRLFSTLESWSGYFEPFADGPLRDADAASLRAHDPTLLVQREAQLLRRLGTRFYLSSGTRDPASRADAVAFAHRLSTLGLAHELRLEPGAHDGRFWRSQLPDALAYAFPA
jgi:enterochelin esterase-like enzyme